jgi:hypothetical protein
VRKLAALAASAALGATGASASHYIITSPRQIRPSVLRQIEAKAAEAVSGGYEWAGPGRFELTGSYPRAGSEWVIEGRFWGGNGRLSVQVICRSTAA